MTLKFRFLILIIFIHNLTFSQIKNISEVTFKGNTKLKVSYLKRLISVKKNTTLDSLLLQEDILFLKRIPAVRNANFTTILKEDSSYNVVYTIEENTTIIPDVNIWTATNRQFSYKVGVYDYNFLGSNITFGGFYQNNGFNSYAINFRAPNLFSKSWGLAIHHLNWKSEEPLFFENNAANYLYNNISFEVLALLQLNSRNNIDVGINFFSEKYQFLSGDVPTSVPRNLDLNKALLKLMYQYNNLAYDYFYVNGFKNILYAQYVVTENNFQNNFLIAWNDFFYYKTIGVRGNWASRLRFGLSSNEASPFAPFALDNNVNLRGVGILVDRGTGSFVLNTEYRHTVYDKKWLAIQTTIFSDFGSWRNPGGSLNDFFERENLRIFSGIGLRFISKKIYNATFRVDYGFKVFDGKNNSNGGLVFGIGQYF